MDEVEGKKVGPGRKVSGPEEGRGRKVSDPVDERGRILDRMRRLCSRREYCSADIHRKVVAALTKSSSSGGGASCGASGGASGRGASGGTASVGASGGIVEAADPKEVAAEIIASLKADKYLDDSRYAVAFARDKAAISGWGRMKIRSALAVKGLDRDIIAQALEEIDEGSASGKMEKVLETKFRSLRRTQAGTDDYALKIKMLRFALGRGYAYEEAAPVIERLISSSDN